MKKNLISIFLLLILAICNACHTSAEPAFTNSCTTQDLEMLDYVVQDDTVSIISISNTNSTLTIPAAIHGLPVTTIGSHALYQNTTCTILTLPETLRAIESSAFYRCYSLLELQIPKSVVSIDGNPFFRATSLENIWVEEENQHYCDMDGVLFSKDRKTMLAYPEGRKDTSYSIPEGVTKFAEDAFGYDTSLRFIYIPDSVINFPDSNIFVYPDEITIVASSNSEARKYAEKYGIRWMEAIPDSMR